MKSIRSILSSAFLLVAASFAFSQAGAPPLDASLTPDPAVISGTFANGLRYYIRENKKPEYRAELRLVVRAGSVLEDSDQLGLAHLIEHMAFNGTKSFPKNELVNFLEKEGVKLGPDVNAYTGFDETVFMLQIPTDSAQLVARAFQILQEWASAVTFDSTEIDKERGVVVEEWRLGRGAFQRVQNIHNPVLFYHSQYADRLPIGKKDIIEHAPDGVITRFYHDWYRPDLMAVVAVGDLDTTAIRNLITKDFSGLTNPPHERKRPEYTLPDHQQTLVSVATDPELPFTFFNIIYKRNETMERTVGDYRRDIVSTLYDGMVNARISERLQKPNPPFVNGGTGEGSFVGHKNAYSLSAIVKENAIVPGLEALVEEAYRVKEHGFTATELDRMKQTLLSRMENAYNERSKTDSRMYADEYIRNFLQEEPYPGIAKEYAMYKELLPSITLAEVDSLANERLAPGNCVVTLSAPKKAGLVVPSDSAILAAMHLASTEKTEAYVDKVSEAPLIAHEPAAGSITQVDSIPALGVTEWTLSNGAHVILKPTDFKNDQILFSAYSRGGLSLSSDRDYLSTRWAATLASISGYGSFDAVSLGKKLQGKIAGVSPTLSMLSEGFSGNAAPKDLETLFQLVYLEFTSPREDTSAFDAFASRQKAALLNRAASPEGAYYDTIGVTLAQYHPRSVPLTPSLIDSIDPNIAYRFYRDRFSDASDFTFFVVGAFTPQDLRPLVERYLASLPATHRQETWKDVGIRYPQGVITKTVYRGIEQKSQVNLIFTGPFTWTPENRYNFSALLEMLNIRLREVLREDLGGTYGVSVYGAPSKYPRTEYSITITFGCSPARVEELVDTVFRELDTLQMKPPPPSYAGKVQEIQRRQREVNLRENGWWMSILRTYYADGEDPQAVLRVPQFIDALTPETIEKAAREYFNLKNYVEVTLKPEKAQ